MVQKKGPGAGDTGRQGKNSSRWRTNSHLNTQVATPRQEFDQGRIDRRGSLPGAGITVRSPNSAAETIYSCDANSATTPSSGFADFVLGRLRCARVRAQIALNQINAAGAAVRGGLIDGETALAILSEAGLLHLIEASS